MSRGGLLLYGATGFTGGLIARRAIELGLDLVLAGRNESRLRQLGAALGCAHRVASLNDSAALGRMLEGISVVLHAAGPFESTYRPMVDACLRAGVHYLDICGEVRAIEGVRQLDRAARSAGVMLMPAVGFDVVPSDCLAARVARVLPGARRLRVAIAGMKVISRGSTNTLMDRVAEGVWVRRDGRLVSLAPGLSERHFDFGSGPVPCLGLSWGDVATAYYTTGIPNIEVYCESTLIARGLMLVGRHLGQAGVLIPGFNPALLKPAADWWLNMLPDGPSLLERARAGTSIVVEAEGARGERAGARLRAPDTYTSTALCATAVASRVLRGDCEPGFQTPARVFGDDVAAFIPGVVVEQWGPVI